MTLQSQSIESELYGAITCCGYDKIFYVELRDFSSTYQMRSTMDDVGSFYYVKDALKNNSSLDYVNYDDSCLGGAIGGSKGRF